MSIAGTAWSVKKINFSASRDLYDRIHQAANDNNSSLSEIIRESLEEKLERLKSEKINKELEIGYQANYELDKQMNEEWKYVDIE